MIKKAIFYANIDSSQNSYVKKVENICKVFNKYGFETKLLIKKSGSENFCTYKNTVYSKNTIFSYINFIFLILISKYNLVYIRHPRLNFVYIFILSLIKLFNRKCFVVHEIPTYPYDYEWQFNRPFEKIKIHMDLISRLFLKYLINLITVIGGFEGKKIFGVKAIEIENGVNIYDYGAYKELTDIETINIIGVGNISLRHGYDRIIKSISKVDSNKFKVKFNIVGTGDEIANLKNLSDKLNIKDSKIFFYGIKNGNDLEKIFCKSHIAVGNLGFHRINVKTSSALKEREFMVRGIPYITVSIDDRLEMNKACVFQVDNSEKDICLETIIVELKKKYTKKNFDYMRNFASKYLNWESSISPLVKEIKKNENN